MRVVTAQPDADLERSGVDQEPVVGHLAVPSELDLDGRTGLEVAAPVGLGTPAGPMTGLTSGPVVTEHQAMASSG
jgi:hypothetical protein